MYVNRGWSLVVNEVFTYTITATVSIDRDIRILRITVLKVSALYV